MGIFNGFLNGDFEGDYCKVIVYTVLKGGFIVGVSTRGFLMGISNGGSVWGF